MNKYLFMLFNDYFNFEIYLLSAHTFIDLDGSKNNIPSIHQIRNLIILFGRP